MAQIGSARLADAAAVARGDAGPSVQPVAGGGLCQWEVQDTIWTDCGSRRTLRAVPKRFSAAASATALHPIQIVARRTGLSADVIRAWERRYAVTSPARSHSGRRLYSDADIERLRLLALATLTGRTIGQVAALPAAKLAALVRQEMTEPGARRGWRVSEAGAQPSPMNHRSACLEAIARFDGPALDAALRRGVIALSAESFLDALIVPLWEDVTAGVRDGRLYAAHRHLALAVLRRTLDRVAEVATSPFATPDIVVTALSGHAPELDMLLAAATAAAEGWRVTSVGPGLPPEDIAETVSRVGASAVTLSLGVAPGDRAVVREVRRLHALLPRGVVIFAQGAAVDAYRGMTRDLDVVPVRDLPTLRARLRALQRS